MSTRSDYIVAIQDLTARDWQTRCHAVQLLGAARTRDAVMPLIDALRDRNRYVREAASLALGRIGDARAITALGETLQTDRVFEVRSAAGEALGMLNDPQVLDVLTQAMLQNPQGFPGSVGRAFIALGQPAFDHLVGLLPTTSGWARGQIAGMLADFPAMHSWARDALRRQAIEPLIAVLDDPVAFARRCAVCALGASGDPRAVEPLTGMLMDADDMARGFAALALGECGDVAAVPMLEQLRRQDTASAIREGETTVANSELARRAIERIRAR
jgi:HEAT repeat protein